MCKAFIPAEQEWSDAIQKPDPLPEGSKFVAVKAGLLACILLMAFPSGGRTVALWNQQF
jgi:hypothetical protein